MTTLFLSVRVYFCIKVKTHLVDKTVILGLCIKKFISKIFFTMLTKIHCEYSINFINFRKYINYNLNLFLEASYLQNQNGHALYTCNFSHF